ncbi:hypothetical protein QT17_08010 [Thermus sp. 2.9]|nr:hypothetical protein QT17_08010 [Thermus sp. 2.9]
MPPGKPVGGEEDQEGEEIDPAQARQDPARGFHQGVAQKPPGEGQLPLLREPLQHHPPPHPHEGRGGEGEEEAEGKGLHQDQGQKGKRPQGAEEAGEALGKPEEVETPEPHPGQEAFPEAPPEQEG